MNHDVAEVDARETAHFEEDDTRSKVMDAKAKYEDALREKFFGFQRLRCAHSGSNSRSAAVVCEHQRSPSRGAAPASASASSIITFSSVV